MFVVADEVSWPRSSVDVRTSECLFVPAGAVRHVADPSEIRRAYTARQRKSLAIDEALEWARDPTEVDRHAGEHALRRIGEFDLDRSGSDRRWAITPFDRFDIDSSAASCDDDAHDEQRNETMILKHYRPPFLVVGGLRKIEKNEVIVYIR